jgi:L-asparagine transporter-like permease
VQGFLLDEVPGGTPKWKIGLMKITAPLFSISVLYVSGVLNYFNPNVVFQMVCSISGMVAMADMIPFKPMDGYDIRKWNFLIWLAAFVFIGVSFTLISLTL